MSSTSTQKQELTKGLGVAVGECVLALYGPFLFQRFGLSVAEAAATGCLIGAVAGYGVAGAALRARNKRQGVSSVPDITKPEVPTGLDEFRTGGVSGTIGAMSTRQCIEAALSRLPQPRSHDIRVEVRDRKVVLKGKVHSWAEEAEAERIAFDMPGIQEVDNRIEVVPER